MVWTRINGRGKKIKVGRFPEMSLADARTEARKIIADAQAGIGPDVRKRREERGTFGAVCADFMQDYANKHRTRGEMQRRINADLAEWRDRPINTITRADAKELLRAKARLAPVSANRLKALISKIGVWATKEEILDANPFANLDLPGGSEKDRARTRALSPDEIKTVWEAFDRLGHPYGSALSSCW